jgi:hypothetical protein
MQSVFTALVTMVAAAVSGQVAPPTDPEASAAVAWLVLLASLGGYAIESIQGLRVGSAL